MKVKRSEWNAMCARIEELNIELKYVRSTTLMEIRTGKVLTSVIVPLLLNHLKVEARHGYAWLIPIDSPVNPQGKAE